MVWHGVRKQQANICADFAHPAVLPFIVSSILIMFETNRPWCRGVEGDRWWDAAAGFVLYSWLAVPHVWDHWSPRPFTALRWVSYLRVNHNPLAPPFISELQYFLKIKPHFFISPMSGSMGLYVLISINNKLCSMSCILWHIFEHNPNTDM